MKFLSFSGDAIPKKKLKGGDNKRLFKGMTKTQFELWCSDKGVEVGSDEWQLLFLSWRKISTS